MYQNDPCKCLTPEVRISYVNLVNPRQADANSTPKYGLVILLPKSDTAALEDIKSAIAAAEAQALNSKWGGFRPNYEPIIHDGDGTRRDGTPYGEECKGHWVINASSTIKPQVVHQSNIQVELAPQDIYSGMYGRVTIRFYGYANQQKGVACGLGNVMKTRDGEPLGASSSAASDFAGLEAVAAPAPAPAQAPPITAPGTAAYPAYGAATQAAFPQQPVQQAPQGGAPVAYPPQYYGN